MIAPRLLWANTHCLLDPTSGAARTALQMLRCLRLLGWEVEVLGMTIFDAPAGMQGLSSRPGEVLPGSRLRVADGELVHTLVQTRSPAQGEITLPEITRFWQLFEMRLDEFAPDIFMFFGGQINDMAAAAEAKRRGIPTVAYLVNGNYEGTRWCRDVDLILTDTRATAALYQQREGLAVMPVGTFIPPDDFVVSERNPRTVLFVSAALAKGAGVVAQLAFMLAERRPDIPVVVIEGRGDWESVVRKVWGVAGVDSALPNVTRVSITHDMRPFYACARVLLAPSLWHESGARVLAEAMLNGIPAIVTDSGGNAEMIGEGGFVFRLPAVFHENPYDKVPTQAVLEPMLKRIIELFDDEADYHASSAQALAVGRERHDIRRNTARLVSALSPLLPRR